ncbi:uncharacterized protein V1516DRAFT_705961 [Lipomyces oligophaga]|uniref:uncharacterized protein n=1 Tax=Lipomyces oligophaga TaxID=45792 RepID=UPI0034CF9E09
MSEIAAYLRSLPSVRQRSNLVYEAAIRGELTNFTLDLNKLPAVVDYVSFLIERDFRENYSSIPPHGRWQNFNVGGRDRINEMVGRWTATSSDEITRRMVDLFVISVLLDAGSGSKWTYTEKDSNYIGGRSEGLAVATYHLFLSGLLSSDPNVKEQVDAKALKSLDRLKVLEFMQHSESNSLAGAEGRVELLVRLGYALDANPAYFGVNGRPGNMFGETELLYYLLQHSNTLSTEEKHSVSVEVVWQVLMDGLAAVWPASRTVVDDVSIGDAWPCSSLSFRPDYADTIVPFHKLSQWLCYSILVPLELYGNLSFTCKELLTGLPEYRNGGLFVDYGVLTLKSSVKERGLANYKVFGITQEDQNVPIFQGEDDVIVEWRAMTICLLDRLLPLVNFKLKTELSLAQLLESGSWKGGRETAAARRPHSKVLFLHTHISIMYKSGTKNSTAVRRLMQEYKQLINESPDGISAGPIDEDNFFEWECLIQGPEDTPYEGGVFPATLSFPKDYPLSPPTMKFTCEIFHPNVYKDGTVCISILHPPGDDPNMYESASERWSPIQSVEKILISVMSMLAEPNDESGANIDACKIWRNDRTAYNKIVRANVRKTLGL